MRWGRVSPPDYGLACGRPEMDFCAQSRMTTSSKFAILACEQLVGIFSMAAASPDELCRLSGVCRDWRSLICDHTPESQMLWDTIGHNWWTPLLERDKRRGMKDRYGAPIYGALRLGINLNRFGDCTSRMELCHRQRMYHLLNELKANGITGQRSIETAEHLIGSGDYVAGRASKSAMVRGIRNGLIVRILVSEHSPFPCHWNGPCGGECDAYGDAECSETDEEADPETVCWQRKHHQEMRAAADAEAREEVEAEERERLNNDWNDGW